MRVLWLTNDLPPRAGGIQQFVRNLLARVHPSTTVVVGPGGDPQAQAYDRDRPYEVVRAPGRILPTTTVRRLTVSVARRHAADVVVLGASWPLGELAPALSRQLDVPVVAMSHGLEAGLAGAGLGHLVRRASRGLDTITTISDWAEGQLRPYLASRRVERVPPGVDIDWFHPGVDGSELRRRWGVPADAPVIGCVSRLVRRKGQDLLLDAWPVLRRRHPDAWLVLVGEGPLARTLQARRERLGRDARVVLAGRADWDDVPACYAAFDLFAMPCRTRLGGIDVEGLGMGYLEAQACGVPAVAGRSGGAPEAVRDGVTGTVVDGRDRDQLVATLDGWLGDAARRETAGAAGRAWVEQRWSWEVIAARFATVLDEVVGA